MIRKLFFILLLLQNVTLFSHADWTIFAYIEASESLQSEAIFNINQMAEGQVPDNVNMIVQLHMSGKNSYVYKIEKNNIIFLGRVPTAPNAKDNILATMQTIPTLYPAEHYGLILWDHGFGILVPQYDEEKNSWDIEPDGNQYGCCNLTRAMLVDDYHKTVMNNEDMVETARIIAEDIIGKKIDLLGFDCCMGAMFEHGYQLRNYANYMVGSQDCELADGFNYKRLMMHFEAGHVTPLQIAQDVVYDYGDYNKTHAPIGRYTMSAFDLAYADQLKNNVDMVAHWLLEVLKAENPTFKNIILDTRRELIRFCMTPSYTDLHHFYQNLYQNLEPYENFSAVQELRKLIVEGKEIIKNAVVANVAGPVNKHAQGISIYFPFSHIDSSYPSTPFANESIWFTFLQDLLIDQRH